MDRLDPRTRRVRDAAEHLCARAGLIPRVAMLLGTGHSAIAERLEGGHTLGDLPAGMELAQGAPLHAGRLHGVPVVVGGPPLASYEGHAPEHVMFPVRVLRAMGADLLILTAGAASLSRAIPPGSLGLVEDHLDFSGLHPLQGPPDADGPRFLDMTEPYAPHWRARARAIATAHGIPCAEAVFAAVPGPALPTRAEYRFLQRVGAELVGMSLVPEVLAARHAGFDVLALVGVTQHVDLDSPTPTPIEAMLDAADLAAPRMTTVLVELVAALGADDDG